MFCPLRGAKKKGISSWTTHADFDKATALSNLRSLLAQGLQQGSYCSSNFYSKNTFLLTLRNQLFMGNLI